MEIIETFIGAFILFAIVYVISSLEGPIKSNSLSKEWGEEGVPNTHDKNTPHVLTHKKSSDKELSRIHKIVETSQEAGRVAIEGEIAELEDELGWVREELAKHGGTGKI